MQSLIAGETIGLHNFLRGAKKKVFMTDKVFDPTLDQAGDDAEEIAEALLDPTLPAQGDRVAQASQWQLMWWRFRRHKPALLSLAVIGLLYLTALFVEVIAPYDPHTRESDLAFAPPQRLHFLDENGFSLRPFVYGFKRDRDPETLRFTYSEDETRKILLQFFVQGEPYALWGLYENDIHLVGVAEGEVLSLLGRDRLGRDMFSRVIYGSRISLSIGLVGVALSLSLGIFLGGLSGYYGGSVDLLIERVIEFLRSLPTIPVWMALAAAIPPDWPPVQVYFGITVVLSFIGWTEMARVVRGRFLSLREEDFVMAARLAGAGELRTIMRHMVPSFLSHIIAALSLAIPGMILAETSLSFLGLGLRPPVVSWGVLLQEAQNVRSVALAPWLLLPGVFVIIAIIAFNFLGDGLRDAADPYAR